MSAATAVLTFRNLVGGELVDAVDGATREILNPATGETIARVPEGTTADVERAVAAARAARIPWRDTGTAMEAIRQLDFGCVWINDHLPFLSEMPQGGFKESGYGKDLSVYALEDYTRVKHAMIKLDEERPTTFTGG